MSLQTNIRDGFKTIVTAINNLTTERGDLSTLSTSNKSNLVAALNEVKTLADSASSSGGAQIDDGVSSSTDKVWSINKIQSQINNAISNIVDSAPDALNTLKELADEIQSNDSQIAALLSSIDNRVRFDAAQSLTAAQKQQARDNIGVHSKSEVGDVAFDFEAYVESELS